jgi:hypothetical protein
MRHEISTLTKRCASGKIFGIGGRDDVTFGLINLSTFPWLVFILLGMCFVRLARANLSLLLSAASGRAEVVLEAFATSVLLQVVLARARTICLKMLMTKRRKKMRRRMSWRLFSSV